MIVKGVKHQLTGMVSLGGFYNNMKKIITRKATYSIVLHRLPVLLGLNTYTFAHIVYNLLYYSSIYIYSILQKATQEFLQQQIYYTLCSLALEDFHFQLLIFRQRNVQPQCCVQLNFGKAY